MAVEDSAVTTLTAGRMERPTPVGVAVEAGISSLFLKEGRPVVLESSSLNTQTH
jgi:hypothetical protein